MDKAWERGAEATAGPRARFTSEEMFQWGGPGYRLPEPLLRTLESCVAEGFVVVVVPAPIETQAAQSLCRWGDLEIDTAGHQARCRGVGIGLTELEFGLLRQLTTHPYRAWTYKELSENVWDVPYFGDSGPVRSSVKRLRRKLDGAHTGVVIEAIRGFGFRLVANAMPPGNPDAHTATDPTLPHA